MSRNSRRTPLARCAPVWLAVTVGTLLVLALLAEQLPHHLSLDVARLDSMAFDVFLARACAVVLAACAAWLWLVTTLVLLEAVTGLALWRAGCPAGLRRALLTACGVALVSTTPLGPVTADTSVGLPPTPPGTTPSTLEGLPLPDRATARTPAPAPSPAQGTLLVESGDTLWAIARDRLSPSASDAEITQAWHRIWTDNRNAIGPDPDLILPGTVLHLTDPKEPR